MMFHCLLLFICCSLVNVHSQTFPYVFFKGQTLANHSYVNLSLVGSNFVSGSDGVQCHTDLGTCCNSTVGSHRGDWYFPDGTRLPIPGNHGIFESRKAQGVNIHHRSSSTSRTGIYRCDIPTNAVHDDDDISVRDAPVYVGLYTGSGGNGNVEKLQG